jgi:hypothetical protein
MVVISSRERVLEGLLSLVMERKKRRINSMRPEMNQ